MLKPTRPLAAPTKTEINGCVVEFVDGWHFELFKYGKRCVEIGAQKKLRAPLWHHFNGFIVDESEHGLPFTLPHHIDFAAMRAYDDVMKGDWSTYSTPVDGSAISDYLRRNIGQLCGEFLGE